jgi:hypothetical protein
MYRSLLPFTCCAATVMCHAQVRDIPAAWTVHMIGDTNTFTMPHATHALLASAGPDSIRFQERWYDRAGTRALCGRLITEAAAQHRSVLFDLVFTDHFTFDIVSDLVNTIVQAYDSVSVDRKTVLCRIHISTAPLRQLDPRPAPPPVKTTVHLRNDGSLLLEGSPIELVELGPELVRRGITQAQITADANATVGRLREILQALSRHNVRTTLQAL